MINYSHQVRLIQYYEKLITTLSIYSWKFIINLMMMARPEGFEPPTHGLENRCSIQLS